jgi:hypothetical protein
MIKNFERILIEKSKTSEGSLPLIFFSAHDKILPLTQAAQ